MKTLFAKCTALALTVLLLAAAFSVTALSAGENLLGVLNPGFESTTVPAGVDQVGTIVLNEDVAHTGAGYLAMNGGHIKFPWFPVKPLTTYTLSFWMQNSKADAIKFWAANNAFLLDGVKSGASLPDMVFGAAREGEDVNVWREVRVNFRTPANINQMNIAINANADDPALLIDDLSLTENKNLLVTLNAEFESTTVPAGVDQVGTIVLNEDVAHTGAGYLAMNGGHIKFPWFSIKPHTNYTLSFWMQNSKADAIKFWAANNTFLLDGAKSGATLPDMVFGEAHEGEDIIWREVRVNFTSPLGINMLNIAINANAEDPYLLIDDLSLVETGKDFGKVTNGDFEEPFIPEFYAFRPWSGISSYGLHVGLGEDSETGNHYLKLLDTAIGGEALEVWYPFSGLEGNRYKISFSQRFTNNGRPSLRFYTGDKPYFGEFPRASLDYIWEDYALYIHGAAPGAAGSLWFTSFDLDNVSIDVDENSLGFYKDIVLYTENAAGRHFPDPFGGATCTTEKTVKANSLSDITAVDGFKTVMTRAHVIPTETAAGTFNREEVTLLTAVYQYDKDGNKCLVNVNIATDASSDGKVLDAVGTVQVPENTATETYKVEAVAWSTVEDMLPLFEKQVLD
ncbi:MAG: hypothetical protein E7408_06060 [Ruminococcaceae bacterium]|nr:hypothetical protein [Oscillospiraceae bacterium]